MNALSGLAPGIILYNGDVRTQDEACPRAEAVAMGAGRILAVGASNAVRALAAARTRQIDLGGRLVLPGFTDAHIHFYEWSLKRQELVLADCGSLNALARQVATAARSAAADQWILGQGWNETDWPEKRMPTRTELDEASPHHPVLLWRCDLHLAAANSAALLLAGITSATADPPEGQIERDDQGEPTGILREAAIQLVRRQIPRPRAQEIRAAFKSGMAALHQLGITGIHDIRLMEDQDGAAALAMFQQLRCEGRLDLRCWVTLSGHHLDQALALGLATGFGDAKLRIGHLKYFFDGGMGARTAWLIDPYRDAGRGMPVMDKGELQKAIGRAQAGGLAVMVHAVGDRANRELIDIFEALGLQRRDHRNRAPSPPIRHRIEHAQMIRPEDARRLAKLDVAVCVTPANMLLDMALIDEALGALGQWTYALRLLLDTGLPVMFSSDCPVCAPDPLLGIYAAVTRQRTDATPPGGWYPASRVSVAEAVRAYTLIPALAHGQVRRLGSIAAGKWADLIVLNENIYQIDPARIGSARIDLTIFEGRIVYQG